MKSIDLAPLEMTEIAVDKRQFDIYRVDETEAQVVIQIIPKRLNEPSGPLSCHADNEVAA